MGRCTLNLFPLSSLHHASLARKSRGVRANRRQVFLVSTLHTHLSVLHLRVHKHYVDYLATETLPPASASNDSSDGEGHWSRPRLRRSRWYNFFSPDDRVAAFRGLWALFAVLSRVVDEDDETDRKLKAEDVVMTDA